MVCSPEKTTKRMYESFWRQFQHSEKVRSRSPLLVWCVAAIWINLQYLITLSFLLQVHVNLLLMEARMQAELLYALRAITRYMTWSAFGVFIVVFLLSLLLLIMGHFKEKKKRKSKGGGRGFNKKMWKRCERPWVVTVLVGWMLRRGSEQNESKEEKKELLKKVISNYKWIHKLSSCCLQCQIWPREGRLLPCWELCARPEHWHLRHPGRLSVFQHATAFVTSLFCLLVEWSPTENPQKAVQPETACTLILSSLSYLFSFFSIFFILYQGKRMSSTMWLLLC